MKPPAPGAPLLPGATIGVLGGGQLGRMMALAARRMGYRICVLDRDARWDRELSEEEQRLLAFARLALRKPNWVIIDEALDTLDASVRQKVLSMFEDQLSEATIINLGRQLKSTKFFTRELHLTKDCEGRKLKPVDLDARVKATRAKEQRKLAKAA